MPVTAEAVETRPQFAPEGMYELLDAFGEGSLEEGRVHFNVGKETVCKTQGGSCQEIYMTVHKRDESSVTQLAHISEKREVLRAKTIITDTQGIVWETPGVNIEEMRLTFCAVLLNQGIMNAQGQIIRSKVVLSPLNK